MYNQKLKIQNYRDLVKEIQRMEGEEAEIRSKARPEKRKAFFEMLTELKEQEKKQREKIKKIIEELNLSKAEKAMAMLYYLEGKTWREAFELSPIYAAISGSEEDDEFVDRKFNNNKTKIYRCIKKILR